MKKIMFNTKLGLEKAVLEGRKTQTRRIVSESLIDEYDNWLSDVQTIAVPSGTTYEKIEDFLIKRSRYFVGEIVAIAQSYLNIAEELEDCKNASCAEHFEKNISDASWYVGSYGHPGFRNKMFTSADRMIHQIRITKVRIERLQDISNEDCLKEGVELNTRQYEYDGTKYYCVRGLGYWRGIGSYNFHTPREAYAALIDKVGKRGDWDKNPYVFVYDFELVK